MRPRTQYAQSGGYSIAWQELGSGPDLVMIPGFVSNVEMMWEIPASARFLERLASFSRLINFDKRGTGLSDRVPIEDLPSFEERIDDVRAVMDAAHSEAAFLFGISEGGSMAARFAVTYPERVNGLVLYGSYPGRAEAASDDDKLEPFTARIEAEWGTGEILAERSVDSSATRGMREALGRFERFSATPAAAAAIVRMGYEIAVSDILPAITAPTVVLHRSADPNISVDGGRALADGIPGAVMIELPGRDHLPFFGDTDAIVDEIERFVTGQRTKSAADRFLGSILFVDIVDSTRIAAEMGDRSWTDLLQRFYYVARLLVERHGGREVNTTGDGLVGLFEGPARAVKCALDLCAEVSLIDLSLRAGVHTGEVRLRGDDLAGLAVHIAARIGALAAPGEVLVSRTVRDLVTGSGLRFAPRGEHTLKGVPDQWALYAAVSA